MDEAQNAHCLIHGTPGRDPLTVEGPFDTAEAAAEKAGLCAEARPDVAAIPDVLVHPDNVRVGRETLGNDDSGPVERLTLDGAVKHAGYDPPPQSLLQRANALARDVDAGLTELEEMLELGPLRDRQRLLREEAALMQDPAGAHVDAQLREVVQVLVPVRPRLRRISNRVRRAT